jgi:hypothetical protein
MSLGGPLTLTIEAWRLKIEPWRVNRPVIAESHHFVEEQDPDLSVRIRKLPHTVAQTRRKQIWREPKVF